MNQSQICCRCVLPSSFPGVRFNAQGVCSYCEAYEGRKESIKQAKEKYRQKFHNLLNQLKLPNQLNNPDKLNERNRLMPYHAIMAYSGGKDSSYTLMLLRREFNLKVLAITFDNGFISERAFQNICKVTEELGVDHLMITPSRGPLFETFKRSLLDEIYPSRALERAAAVCNTCMNIVKSYLLKTAIELGIPWVFFGWSPGQAPLQSALLKWNAALLRKTQESTNKILFQLMGEDAFPYLLSEEHYSLFEKRVKNDPELYFYQVNPLAFFEYGEEKIIEGIMKMGWEPPQDTDSNSTNCLLNSFAIETHVKKYDFHPYALEISGLVREGNMTREEGLKKLSTPPDPKVVDYVKKRLKIDEN